MLRLNKNSGRNTSILVFVILFLIISFGAPSANAQTRSARKTPADSASKKTTSAPKKADKKTTDKTSEKQANKKATPKNSTAKSAADKKSTDKKSADKKTSAKKPADKKSSKTAETKTKGKAEPVKTSSKTSAKSASQPAKSTQKTAKTANSSTQTKNEKKADESKIKTNLAKSPKTIQAKSVSQPAPREPSEAIVSVASARVRTEPNTNSSEIRRLKLGTLVKVLEENSAWYKVQISSSSKQSGWVSKQVADDFDKDNRTEIYRRIVSRNFKSDKMSFADAAELYDFLTQAQNEIKDSSISADIAFKQILTLNSALKAIPFGKGEEKPYSEFLKSNNKSVVYSDPSAQWYVRSELLWELQKKYSKEAIAEEIAWTAAQNPLPGECEGYINCYLFVLRETDGEYLNLYPNGKYAAQALKNIRQLLEPISTDLKEKTVYNGPTDVSDRAEFNKLLAELRTIVSKLPFAEIEKQNTIQQINKIAEGYR